MLKPLVSKLHLDLSTRLKNIAEKQVPAKLKPIVNGRRVAEAVSTGKVVAELRKRIKIGSSPLPLQEAVKMD